MISGRNKPAEYASRENLTPGKTSSVMHAPPTIGRRSRTRTFSPAFARYAAETRPLWPPPTMTASHAPATVLGDGGYLLELEKRGYVQPGPFTPEVVVERPSAVKELHQEFLDAGAEVLQSLAFYASKEKLATVGYANKVRDINRGAVRLARE